MNLASPRVTMFLCCAAMTCLAVSVNLPPVYLTTFGETFGGPKGLSVEQLGRIPAVLFVTMVSGVVLVGPLTDRWGARLLVMGGLGFIAAGLGLFAASVSYLMLLTGAGLLGFGAAVLEVTLNPIVAAARPKDRTSAFNQLHFFYSVGAVGTVLIGSAALRFQVPWRVVCLSLAAPPLLTVAGFAAFQTPSHLQESEERIPIRQLIRRPYLLAVALAIFLGGAAEIGMAQWLPAYAERGLGFSKATGAAALAAFAAAMAVGRIVASKIAHRIGSMPLIASSCVACFLFYTAACFVPNAGLALTACICVGFSVACLWPSILALAGDRYPNGGASMYAMITASGNVGAMIMPWTVGLTAQYAGLKYGMLTTAVCPAALIVLLTWMKRRERRD